MRSGSHRHAAPILEVSFGHLEDWPPAESGFVGFHDNDLQNDYAYPHSTVIDGSIIDTVVVAVADLYWTIDDHLSERGNVITGNILASFFASTPRQETLWVVSATLCCPDQTAG
jgi:hypothetical protein